MVNFNSDIEQRHNHLTNNNHYYYVGIRLEMAERYRHL